MPKIIGASIEDHRELTRRRIFDALTGLLAERPYDEVTMTDLAARAGVGRSALYLERLHERLADADAPLDQLAAYVRFHLASSQELHVGLGPEPYPMLSPASLGRIREHVEAVEEVLRDVLRRGAAEGEMMVPDVDAAVALVHACLQARRVDPAAIEAFVVRALAS